MFLMVPVQSGAQSEITFLKPGEVVDFNVGAGDQVGIGKLRFEKGRYILQIKLGFIGAGLFGRTNPQEVQELVKIPMPSQEFFKKNVTSFKQIPIVEEKINNIIRLIETQTHNTDFLAVEIATVLVDDADILNKSELRESNYNVYASSLYQKIPVWQKKHPDTVPIIMTATPSPYVATPTFWDPYSQPLLFAHEFSHLLGVSTEGYQLYDYPANGIMNDEITINGMKRMGFDSKIQMLRADFNEAMVSRFRIKLSNAKLKKYFSPTSPEIYNHGVGAFSVPADNAEAFVNDKIQKYMQSLEQY
jgi:hypothetical protein